MKIFLFNVPSSIIKVVVKHLIIEGSTGTLPPTSARFWL
jgi:hypothetical protein